jgi:hypothetical protein
MRSPCLNNPCAARMISNSTCRKHFGGMVIIPASTSQHTKLRPAQLPATPLGCSCCKVCVECGVASSFHTLSSKALEKLKSFSSTRHRSLVKQYQLRLLHVFRESTPHDGTDKRRDNTKVHPATVNKRLRGKACASSSQHALQPPAELYYTRPRRRR